MESVNNGELIDSSRISVVIQGLTHYIENDKNCLFYRCVNSIKQYLPEAEIIVSTWKGQSCDESVVDIVLYNDEPESITSDADINFKWNFNKMVVSTKSGIIASNREYALKFRADLSLIGIGFLGLSLKIIFLKIDISSEFFKILSIFQTFLQRPCFLHLTIFYTI
jgi:hypothetical protein